MVRLVGVVRHLTMTGSALWCRSRSSTLTGLLALGALLTLTGCATGHRGAQAERTANVVATTSAQTSRSAPLPRPLRLNFSIFRSVPTLTPHPLTTTRQPQDVNWSQARRLTGAPTPIWAVPMAQQLCFLELANHGAVTRTCTTIANAISHGLFTVSLIDPSIPAFGFRRTVVGIVRDQVTEVEIETPSANGVRVPVHDDGMFLLQDDATAAPSGIRLID
jgi:hypothetical protein